MSNSINNISKVDLAVASANLDGIQFNNIQRSGYNSTTQYVRANTPWSTLDTSTPVKPAVNAVDIDWNEAVIPYGNLETGDSVTVNSTGELLSLINKISKFIKTHQEVYYTIDALRSSQTNFYNDLTSNKKKVYIDDKPVIRYREIRDAALNTTIYAYVLTDYMGVPYIIEYQIPINSSSAITNVNISIRNLYNYFSPTVLIDVSNNSTTYSSIDISVVNEVITIPIDAFVTYFLQSCDIFAKVKGDNTDTYWRLDGRNIGSVTSSINNTITRYICPMDMSYSSGQNDVYRVSITWDLNAKTITTIME